MTMSSNIATEMSPFGFPGGHALLIAVAGYPKVLPLPPVILNDARAMAEVLTSPSHCGYNRKNVTMLLDSQATLEAIRTALKELADRTLAQDTVVVFFSGHGANIGSEIDPESALVPFDCDPDNLMETLLSAAEFSAALTQIRAQRVIVLIDACHSGGATSFKGMHEIQLGFSEKSLAKLAQGTGRVSIASSKASEYSLVFEGAKNSLFSQHLLDALRGECQTDGDGIIRVFELFNYTSEKVRQAAPGQQHPIFKASNLEDNFPVALARGGVKNAAATSQPLGHVESWSQLEKIFADLYPAGPQDQEVWTRAGGDISRLRLNGTGRANWFAGLRALRQGGGGADISKASLIEAALDDFPHHQELLTLRQSR